MLRKLPGNYIDPYDDYVDGDKLFVITPNYIADWDDIAPHGTVMLQHCDGHTFMFNFHPNKTVDVIDLDNNNMFKGYFSTGPDAIPKGFYTVWNYINDDRLPERVNDSIHFLLPELYAKELDLDSDESYQLVMMQDVYTPVLELYVQWQNADKETLMLDRHNNVRLIDPAEQSTITSAPEVKPYKSIFPFLNL